MNKLDMHGNAVRGGPQEYESWAIMHMDVLALAMQLGENPRKRPSRHPPPPCLPQGRGAKFHCEETLPVSAFVGSRSEHDKQVVPWCWRGDLQHGQGCPR